MTPQDRIAQINQTLQAIQTGWLFLCSEMDSRMASLTVQLINNDNEQVRGRIKALRELKELPETLQQERDGISAALSEQDAAN